MPSHNSSLKLLGLLDVHETSSEAEIWFAYFKKVYEHLKRRVQDAEVVGSDLGLYENIKKIKALFERVVRESSDDEWLMELTEAYQVLSDPGSKEAYVDCGTRPEPASLVHYSVILQMVFGSVAFKKYVGTTTLDSLAAVMEVSNLGTNDLMDIVLKNYGDLLKTNVEHLVKVMNKILQQSSRDLRRGVSQEYTPPPTALCRDMLKTIGPIYKSNAELRLSRDQEQADPQGSRTYQKEATLWEVCRSVLENVTDRERKKRAKKLQKLGEILEKTGTGRNKRRTWINFI